MLQHTSRSPQALQQQLLYLKGLAGWPCCCLTAPGCCLDAPAAACFAMSPPPNRWPRPLNAPEDDDSSSLPNSRFSRSIASGQGVQLQCARGSESCVDPSCVARGSCLGQPKLAAQRQTGFLYAQQGGGIAQQGPQDAGPIWHPCNTQAAWSPGALWEDLHGARCIHDVCHTRIPELLEARYLSWRDQAPSRSTVRGALPEQQQ